jgi:hypothetical protein
MGILNAVLNKVFDVLFLPVRGLSPWVAMILVSLLTSFLMLLIFRHTSNQAGIRKEKNLIKAHLLELRLFKDNMGVQLRAQGRILLANFRYVAHNMKPMLVMIVPVLLILIQLNLWFGAESLKPGDTVLVKVRLVEGKYPSEVPASLAVSPELEIETPSVSRTRPRSIGVSGRRRPERAGSPSRSAERPSSRALRSARRASSPSPFSSRGGTSSSRSSIPARLPCPRPPWSGRSRSSTRPPPCPSLAGTFTGSSSISYSRSLSDTPSRACSRSRSKGAPS